jgi:hypothetical protein
MRYALSSIDTHVALLKVDRKIYLLAAFIHIFSPFAGNFNPIDVTSVYTPEVFQKWAFNCHYGFGGNVVHFMRRYAAFGNRRLDAAFIKALTSSKLRSVPVIRLVFCYMFARDF